MTYATSLGQSLAAFAAALTIVGAAQVAGADEPPPSTTPAATQTPSAPTPGEAAPPAEEAPYPFWTKYAYFVPSRFGDLPGWHDDDLSEAWKAFVQSCTALGRRPVWSETCDRAAQVNARDSGAVRRYMEREFVLFEIRNTDRSAAGTITGYYEPLLHGSREAGARFVYPVYGTPDDLLYLEARSIPDGANGWPIRLRVEGRKVVFVCAEQPGANPCAGPLRLDLGAARPDVRDKRFRVRIDGDRVVPYYTRAEIEHGALAGNRALLWVDDPAALYSMQMQGSGKVRMPDGQVVRLAFAEQNGHPFTPPVRKRPNAPGRRTVLTRGIALPDDDATAPEADEDASVAPAVRGVRPIGGDESARAPLGAPKPTDENLSPEVARMVELLLEGTGSAGPQRIPVAPPPAGTSANAKAGPGGTVGAAPAPAPRNESAALAPSNAAAASPKAAGASLPTPFSSDPSYVFFRQIPDNDAGPPGALGVPLTAGRSLAVDPRTTPLGSPVFISTEGVSDVGRLNRLMLAQDTGGAIRGAVRADYFWGFGPTAGDRASRMKESGRMWLLLPKGLRIAAAATAKLTRGIGGPGPNAAECLVPDPELCVE
jgi:membrane-bound lytic murein transglycosylase A